MKVHEIMEDASSGSTGSGSVAVMVQPLGTQTRQGGSMLSGKYTANPSPNTPEWMKQFKKKVPNARR